MNDIILKEDKVGPSPDRWIDISGYVAVTTIMFFIIRLITTP